ncbi:acid phosphatase [Methylomonas sp. LL1]|uniref:acid phosphatase n=1 Tax=Methylomonas sp. LL1 TaxID=2785785 RepID=UPI001E32B2B7|nr:phosphatase PAP2 family protein [Methylomonas sp. LL1]
MNRKKMRWRAILPSMVLSVIVAGCVNQTVRDEPVSTLTGASERLVGYLPAAELPNSLTLVPPPPPPDSSALALDEDISRRSFSLRDTPRWALAISDADLSFPHAAATFACALNAPVSEADTPRLYRLLRRTLSDVGGSTRAAKDHYKRVRPFVRNNQPLCTPNDQSWLVKDGSYPSGHTAIGWGWALILAEISPEQTNAILLRGRSFGESRNVCNVHWHSDVVQGRNVAAGAVARLHAAPEFLADLEAAKAEIAAVRGKGLKPNRDCAAEDAALLVQPSLAQ